MTRREFSTSTKRDAWDRCRDRDGIPRCERCTVALGPANTFYDFRSDGEFDHAQPDAMLGEPSLANCLVLCRTCHKRKTKRDISTIAKSNRVRDRARGIKPSVYRPLIGTIASGVKLSLRPFARPIDRRTGEEL